MNLFVTTNRSIYNNIIFKDVILYIYIFIETIKNRKSIHKSGGRKKKLSPYCERKIIIMKL